MNTRKFKEVTKGELFRRLKESNETIRELENTITELRVREFDLIMECKKVNPSERILESFFFDIPEYIRERAKAVSIYMKEHGLIHLHDLTDRDYTTKLENQIKNQ